MIRIKVGLDDVAGIRFTSNAVWETTASLIALAHPERHPIHRPLLGTLPDRPAFDMGLLYDLVSIQSWYPDTLAPTPIDRPASALAQLTAVADTDPELAERDLGFLRSRQPGRRWDRMSAAEYVDETTHALVAYWRCVLEPIWARIEAITAADIAHRSVILCAKGVGAALDSLGDAVAFRDNTILLDMPGWDEHMCGYGRGLWLVPSVFRWPRVSLEAFGEIPTIAYPARGAGRLWDRPPVVPADSVSLLLGRSRAAILAATHIPKTTASLASELRLARATVSEHLSVLTAAGLLGPRRDGRRVLYGVTELGETLLRPRRGEPAYASDRNGGG